MCGTSRHPPRLATCAGMDRASLPETLTHQVDGPLPPLPFRDALKACALALGNLAEVPDVPALHPIARTTVRRNPAMSAVRRNLGSRRATPGGPLPAEYTES